MKRNKKFFHARDVSPITGESQWVWINVDHISAIEKGDKNLTVIFLTSASRIRLKERDAKRLYKLLGLN